MSRLAWIEASNSITVCCVVTSSPVVGVVGDQQGGLAGDRHRDHHALAHAAGQLVRVGLQALDRVADADGLEQGESLGLRVGELAVRLEHVGDLPLDGADRLSATRGFWKIIEIAEPRKLRRSA